MICYECQRIHDGPCDGVRITGSGLNNMDRATEASRNRADHVRMNIAARHSHLSVEGDELYVIVKLKLDTSLDNIDRLDRMKPGECLRYAIDVQEV